MSSKSNPDLEITIARIKKQNEELKLRHLEVEADKQTAAKDHALVKNGPPSSEDLMPAERDAILNKSENSKFDSRPESNFRQNNTNKMKNTRNMSYNENESTSDSNNWRRPEEWRNKPGGGGGGGGSGQTDNEFQRSRVKPPPPDPYNFLADEERDGPRPESQPVFNRTREFTNRTWEHGDGRNRNSQDGRGRGGKFRQHDRNENWDSIEPEGGQYRREWDRDKMNVAGVDDRRPRRREWDSSDKVSDHQRANKSRDVDQGGGGGGSRTYRREWDQERGRDDWGRRGGGGGTTREWTSNRATASRGASDKNLSVKLSPQGREVKISDRDEGDAEHVTTPTKLTNVESGELDNVCQQLDDITLTSALSVTTVILPTAITDHRSSGSITHRPRGVYGRVPPNLGNRPSQPQPQPGYLPQPAVNPHHTTTDPRYLMRQQHQHFIESAQPAPAPVAPFTYPATTPPEPFLPPQPAPNYVTFVAPQPKSPPRYVPSIPYEAAQAPPPGYFVPSPAAPATYVLPEPIEPFPEETILQPAPGFTYIEPQGQLVYDTFVQAAAFTYNPPQPTAQHPVSYKPVMDEAYINIQNIDFTVPPPNYPINNTSGGVRQFSAQNRLEKVRKPTEDRRPRAITGNHSKQYEQPKLPNIPPFNPHQYDREEHVGQDLRRNKNSYSIDRRQQQYQQTEQQEEEVQLSVEKNVRQAVEPLDTVEENEDDGSWEDVSDEEECPADGGMFLVEDVREKDKRLALLKQKESVKVSEYNDQRASPS